MLTGDGKPDLISANSGWFGSADTLSVLTNNGSGGFTLASTPTVGRTPASVTATDVNGDGKVDLISANFDGHTTDGTDKRWKRYLLDWPKPWLLAAVLGR